MQPEAGERCVRFVGDFVEFTLDCPDAAKLHEAGGSARLRTNLGRAAQCRKAIVESKFEKVSLAGAEWRDVPMRWDGSRWMLSLPLTEVGYFSSKAYLLDARGFQHWPAGDNVGVSVHPEGYRTANTIYCAFPRMFGENKGRATTLDAKLEAKLNALDESGYSVIPPSGKLRDLKKELPFVFNELGCRIVHLLPVNPTPTTMARMGRFGSPYAAQDLMGIDPALVDFDMKSTGVEQFRGLTNEAHRLGGRVFLDLVINHTGWGSKEFEEHPEWFVRDAAGEFESPGAWGVTWGDLVELAHKDAGLWEYLAEVFLTWCRRGVDGFRCDAGYKVPTPAWQHIIARVRQEFPDAVFLLEGLGGGWHDTERLLTDGGMQWAYSELFQEFNGPQVAGYLDHAFKQCARAGILVHYSETHDNERLAVKGKAWSLLRNRLCALTSVSGGFGFTCGVEWLAAEKIKVHGANGLNWNGKDNIVPELRRLNELVSDHPCFFDGAELKRLTPIESPVYALLRKSAECRDSVLVLVNTDVEKAQSVALDAFELSYIGELSVDLLGQKMPKLASGKGDSIKVTLASGACYCLGATMQPLGLSGDAYRKGRHLASRALAAICQIVPGRNVGLLNWLDLKDLLELSPADFLAAVSKLEPDQFHENIVAELSALQRAEVFPNVIEWTPERVREVTVIPSGHWLLIVDECSFRARLRIEGAEFPVHREAIRVGDHWVCWFDPQSDITASATLDIERYAEKVEPVAAKLLFQNSSPASLDVVRLPRPDDLILLTNGRGGMARMCVDLGRVKSKYDCVLGANLDAELPVDRHVFAKRVRVWVDADGFITPLDYTNLVEMDSDAPARWRFVASAGDGRSVEIYLLANMIPGENTTVLRFERPSVKPLFGQELPAECHVRLTVRFDIEDRNFHWETKRNESAEHHFDSNVEELQGRAGFAFQPDEKRRLEIWTCAGQYHAAPEWSENLPHPIEASRGMTGHGDGFSPGWFELPLRRGETEDIIVTADHSVPFAVDDSVLERPDVEDSRPADEAFASRLNRASEAFVVRREGGKTVIAGYPWFLDWGRDTLICARGLLAAGMEKDVKDILRIFARFEEKGTMPNTIHGANASNRDTSDAPLWFGVVCEDLAGPDAHANHALYREPVGEAGRNIVDVLRSIAENYHDGTSNGIRVDPATGLVWSPSHFTWMDTNYPAGTPREGYPIEIQALWIRLLRQLQRLKAKPFAKPYAELALLAEDSFNRLFWLEHKGWFADVLIAVAGESAEHARPDEAMRSNCLLPISLGVIQGEKARRTVNAATRHLVVPGALRSLAPLPVEPRLPIYSSDKKLLNNPEFPYWGRYEGDEDTCRKPAYHNGTAWTWPFPVFCEALVRAWEQNPESVQAARAYLCSMEHILNAGCLGQLPEIIDGDAPHSERGCDAQAWGATEALRVWRMLS